MTRSVTARVLTALATVLLLLVAVCAASGATSQVVTAGTSQGQAGQGGAPGSSNGSGRGDADGELSKDEAPRTVGPQRRRRETGVPAPSGRHHRVRDAVGVPARIGTAVDARPQAGRTASTAAHLARLQVFRC